MKVNCGAGKAPAALRLAAEARKSPGAAAPLPGSSPAAASLRPAAVQVAVTAPLGAPLPTTRNASVSPSAAAGASAMVKVAASVKFTATSALCSAAVDVRVTAPPPAAAVGPSSAAVVMRSSAVRVTVRVWSASAAPRAENGSANVSAAEVCPAATVTLPLRAAGATW